jgi:hypothetical protein
MGTCHVSVEVEVSVPPSNNENSKYVFFDVGVDTYPKDLK